MAASKAASTVIDAAIAVEVSRLVCHFLYERSSIDDWEDILFCIHLLLSVDLQLIYINVVLIYCRSAISEGESQDIKATAQEANEDVDEFFILDSDSLAKLREKFCIQCLIILGEYVEVLGPVLHEKGVDVCIGLLQRNSKHKEGCRLSLLLPDVLKLICALAAHRKFAAVFVDRGGMQKLLAAPRAPQTFCGLSSCLFAIGSIQVTVSLHFLLLFIVIIWLCTLNFDSLWFLKF